MSFTFISLKIGAPLSRAVALDFYRTEHRRETEASYRGFVYTFSGLTIGQFGFGVVRRRRKHLSEIEGDEE